MMPTNPDVPAALRRSHRHEPRTPPVTGHACLPAVVGAPLCFIRGQGASDGRWLPSESPSKSSPALLPAHATEAASQDWPPFVLVSDLLLVGVVADEGGLFCFCAAGLAAARCCPRSNLTNQIVLGHLHLSAGQFLRHMVPAAISAALFAALVIGVAERRALWARIGPIVGFERPRRRCGQPGPPNRGSHHDDRRDPRQHTARRPCPQGGGAMVVGRSSRVCLGVLRHSRGARIAEQALTTPATRQFQASRARSVAPRRRQRLRPSPR